MMAEFLKNKERGQMTIFIAMIFQVLFIFFAMIINIGLIVHDKINLQNSVDLAAYYGAQKQAEVLNAIAHHNYQLRQAWKLLSFRVRVMGDIGNKNHPLSSLSPSGLGSGADADVPAFSAQNHVPYVCLAQGIWNSSQNLCYTQNLTIPELPSFTLVNPFLPLNFGAVASVDQLRNNLGDNCESESVKNFEVAVRWMAAYRSQIAYAKKSLRAYAQRLSENPADFKDIRGDSAAGGALKTLVSNLTVANRAGMSQDGFQFYNSLGVGDYKEWLNEVPIYPYVFYAQLYSTGPGNCSVNILPINSTSGTRYGGLPTSSYVVSPEIASSRDEPSQPLELTASTFGYEKNPWMMGYVAVYAESRPRKPYLPFGKPIVLKAKAYAKPFGGRVGPWYYSEWPRGSQESAGGLADRLDKQAPVSASVATISSLAPSSVDSLIPNYSRYPGDQLGLRSRAALTVFRDVIRQKVNAGNTFQVAHYTGIPQGSDGLAYALVGSQFASGNDNNSLFGYSAPWVRDMEAAAIAPDLFDATYYSVDPDGYANYIQAGINSGIATAQEASYDQGSLASANLFRGIGDQINVLNQLVPPSVPRRFFYIKNQAHLLTAWAPSNAYEYGFPTETFGKCEIEGAQAVPGRCAVGGRVGYSVKIISEDYLKTSTLKLGGGSQQGPILNPPPF